METCPHYLAFAAEEIADGDTRFKCAPPIRDVTNRQNLWEALIVCQFYDAIFVSKSYSVTCFTTGFQDGHIDMLSSDHSPSIPELKLFDEGDFLRAWGGISSLQVS